MTLSEYFDQIDPVRMPFVELQPGEYWQGHFIGVAGHRIAPLTIDKLPYSYLVKEGNNKVFTQDYRSTCFNIK